MKKTKIICSIGPSSVNYDVMKQMIINGMNIARINFSHASMEDREKTISVIDQVNNELGSNVSIMYDTKGPDFRTGLMVEGGINLIEGNTVKIIKKDILGTNESFTVNFKNVLDQVLVGNHILLDDGLIELEVIERLGEDLNCRVIKGGNLKSKKSINIPEVNLNIKFLSVEDREDIKYACSKSGDFLALSFVNNKDNILEIRKILSTNNSSMKIVSKIESREAVNNLDEIIRYSDAVMVARGDLGVEISFEEIPIIQKEIIRKCRIYGKPCIVATEMMASMYTASRPTRAEVTDIANAIFDGADAVMLSGETTIGKYPIDAVRYMSKICEKSELKMQEFYINKGLQPVNNQTKELLNDISSYKIIIVKNIDKAILLSNFKVNQYIYVVCHDIKIMKELSIYWGIIPILSSNLDNELSTIKKQFNIDNSNNIQIIY